jgi:hypothetical protein
MFIMNSEGHETKTVVDNSLVRTDNVRKPRLTYQDEPSWASEYRTEIESS